MHTGVLRFEGCLFTGISGAVCQCIKVRLFIPVDNYILDCRSSFSYAGNESVDVCRRATPLRIWSIALPISS